jgi:hypothetical protein
LQQRTRHYARTYDLGIVYTAETGFLLSHNRDTIYAPDAALVGRNANRGVSNGPDEPDVSRVRAVLDAKQKAPLAWESRRVFQPIGQEAPLLNCPLCGFGKTGKTAQQTTLGYRTVVVYRANIAIISVEPLPVSRNAGYCGNALLPARSAVGGLMAATGSARIGVKSFGSPQGG